MIAGEDKHALRAFLLQDMDILIDAVRGPSIPAVHVSHLGRDAFDEFIKLVAEDAPPETYVTIKRR
jgi:hypothetical protein